MLAALMIQGAVLMLEPGQDARSRFIERCRSETVARSADAANWATEACAETWTQVARSNPMADTILAASGGPSRAEDLRRRTPLVRWTGSTGQLGALQATIDAAEPTLTLRWQAMGEPVPYDVTEALKARGATTRVIGCFGFGLGEQNRVHAVDMPGHAPFALTVYRRDAPTASAYSIYGASVRTDGVIPTLDDLRRADGQVEWRTDCG